LRGFLDHIPNWQGLGDKTTAAARSVGKIQALKLEKGKHARGQNSLCSDNYSATFTLSLECKFGCAGLSSAAHNFAHCKPSLTDKLVLVISIIIKYFKL
jgi:hypothetical protein